MPGLVGSAFIGVVYRSPGPVFQKSTLGLCTDLPLGGAFLPGPAGSLIGVCIKKTDCVV